MSHTIAAVRFDPGKNDGACDCACGWSGRASAFAEHRKEAGAADPSSSTRAPEGFRISRNTWNRSSMPARVP